MKSKNNSSSGRRAFLKNTAVVTGGLLVNGLPVSASAYVGGNDDIKVAVIGCGGRGTGAASQAIQAGKHIKLVAMADAFADNLEESYNTLMKAHGESGQMMVKDAHKFVGFDAYKKATDLADVVILCTPPGFRPFHFEYAIEQGKHVFMEKPVATDSYGVRKVLAAAEVAKAKKLNVVVGLQRRYQRNYLEAIKRIHAGEIGKIVAGQVYWNNDGVWVRERKTGQSEMEYQMRNWYYFNWLCGDHILEQHIHNIDVANWFIGEYPTSAQGMGGREVRNGKDHGEIFDHHFVEFTYPGGAVISSQCRHQPGCLSRVSEQFQGTAGTIYTDSGNATLLKDYQGNIKYQHQGEEDANPYQVEHDELFAAIRNGALINNAEFGAKSTMSAILGRMATYSGKLVTWEEALASDLRLVPDPDQWSWDKPIVMPDENGRYAIPVPGVTRVI
jgi:myo-inositol 2-dehydrogenase / D-chiro-inositol 1-dehydrogenase